MGRHAANWPAPEPEGGGRRPMHADLFLTGSSGGAVQDRAAAMFDALVEPHREAMYAYVMRLTEGDEALAESVLKETFYRAAAEPDRYPQRPSAVRPWLVLIARTVLRDGERLAPAGHDDRPARGTGERSSRRAKPAPITVVRAMDELSPVHRELLVELVYKGVSLQEAAGGMGVPVETVKSRLYFAMRALRVVLDQQVADLQE
jgi:RNA polymerase sigma-70 factor (ECF subfamily)